MLYTNLPIYQDLAALSSKGQSYNNCKYVWTRQSAYMWWMANGQIADKSMQFVELWMGADFLFHGLHIFKNQIYGNSLSASVRQNLSE